VLDTVMLAKSGDPLLSPDAVDALRRLLLPQVSIITPNLPEAAALLDSPIATSEQEMCQQGEGIRAYSSSFHGQALLQTRKYIPLEQAILHTTSPQPEHLRSQSNFPALIERTRMTRYGGECYAMAMLAAGHIDVCVEFSLQPYDIVPLIPIIEQAGGIVTTLWGQRAESGGPVVASGCPVLHQQVLNILNG